jgi:hypothetical protein
MTLPLRRPVLAVIMAMRLYQRLCETLPRPLICILPMEGVSI